MSSIPTEKYIVEVEITATGNYCATQVRNLDNEITFRKALIAVHYVFKCCKLKNESFKYVFPEKAIKKAWRTIEAMETEAQLYGHYLMCLMANLKIANAHPSVSLIMCHFKINSETLAFFKRVQERTPLEF